MKAVLGKLGWMIGGFVTETEGRIRSILAFHYSKYLTEEFLFPIPQTPGSVNLSAGCSRENASTREDSKGTIKLSAISATQALWGPQAKRPSWVIDYHHG